MCRFIVHLFLGFILIAFIPLAIAVGLGYLNLANSEFYKRSLVQADAHRELSELAYNSIVLSIVSTGDLNDDLPRELLEGTPDIVKKLVNPKLMQQFSERNIDNLFNYLSGAENDLTVYLPTNQIVETLDELVDKIEQNTITALADKPVCGPGEEPGFSLECRPASGDPQDTLETLPSGGISREDLLTYLNQAYPFLQVDKEQYGVGEILEGMQFPPEQITRYRLALGDFRSAYTILTIGFIATIALSLVLLTLFVTTARSWIRSKITSLAFVAGYIGFLALGAALILLVNATSIASRIDQVISANDALDEIINAVLISMIGDIRNQLLLLGGVAFLISLILLFVRRIFPKPVISIENLAAPEILPTSIV